MTVPPGGPAYDAPPPSDDGGSVLVPAAQHEIVPAGYAPAHPAPAYWSPEHGYGYPPARRTNVLAILSLVFAFVFPPAGLVLGLIARGQIRDTGEEGRGLAIAGIAVSAAYLGLAVLLVACYVILLVFVAALFAHMG